MAVFSIRQSIFSCALACSLAWITTANVDAQECLSLAGASPDELPVAILTSGNATIDQQIHSMNMVVARAFRVYPRLVLFDDEGSPNAFATPVVTLDSRPDGTIMFGLGLLQQEYQRWHDDLGGLRYTYGPVSILAHEYAHILQVKKGVKHVTLLSELEADFMAGWFLGRETLLDPEIEARDGMEAFYSRGDYEFNNPSHHGTPQQRLAAFMAGYATRRNPLRVAFDSAEAYVEQ